MDDPVILGTLWAATKTAIQFRETISDAVGGLFRPWQIKRVGAAEAEVERLKALTKAETDLEITEIQRRAMSRLLNEEAQRQANMEAIAEKGIALIGESARPAEVERDWIVHFFESARLVSNDEMQALWAKVLAGEAEQPGRFSKRTIEVLRIIEKVDAEFFNALCRFVWLTKHDTPVPIIYDLESASMRKGGLTFGRVQHLAEIGLVSFNDGLAFSQVWEPPEQTVSYFGRLMKLNLSKREGAKMNLGRVMFTRVGCDLLSVCRVEPLEGLFEEMIETWATVYKYEVERVEGPGGSVTRGDSRD